MCSYAPTLCGTFDLFFNPHPPAFKIMANSRPLNGFMVYLKWKKITQHGGVSLNLNHFFGPRDEILFKPLQIIQVTHTSSGFPAPQSALTQIRHYAICATVYLIHLMHKLVPGLLWQNYVLRYTCQVSCLRRDYHACGSKTSISCLLTPVFPFLTLGGKVRANKALTDSF